MTSRDTKPVPDLGPLLTPREAFARLGISERTGRAWIAAGRLPVVRLSARCLRIDRRDLERFVSEHRRC